MINWVKTAGGESYDDSHSICSGLDGDVYLAGITGGTTVFDTKIHVSEDFTYPFLAKIDISSITDVSLRNEKQSLHVYPNPATNRISIKAEETESFIIFNSRGEKMKEGRLTDDNLKLDIDDLDSGIYIILLNADLKGTVRTSKLSTLRKVS